jgi:hypothetical protein
MHAGPAIDTQFMLQVQVNKSLAIRGATGGTCSIAQPATHYLLLSENGVVEAHGRKGIGALAAKWTGVPAQ